MNTRLAYVVFAFSFVVVIYVGLIRNGKDDLESKAVPLKAFDLNPERDPARTSPAVSPSPGATAPVTKTSGLKLEDFREKYGPELQLEKDESGRITAILAQEVPRSAGRNPARFSPRDTQAAIRRASEILADARDLLGLDEAMPLIDPRVTATAHHAQVVFHQSIDGVPLAPSGHATVLLDREGNLKALYSNYLRRTMVSNQPKLPHTEGRRIYWVQSTTPVAQLKHAYETRKDGFQLVIDAEDGRVLQRRNKRIY